MGKGGSTTSVEIPAYIEEAAKRNLNRADKISSIGSVPLSYGPTLAAFTPMQQSAFTNTANAANAFGLNAPQGLDIYGGMGSPSTYANGITAYSAAPLYDQTLAAFGAARPGQKSYIDSFFINPFTGLSGSNVLPEINYDDIVTTTDTTDTTDTTSTSTSTSTGSDGDSDTTSTNVISTVPVDQQTGNFYQDNQLYNPDIDYSDPFIASNNQIVGVIDPTDESLQIVQDAYGIDPSFYTDSPIYSSSDFRVGSSATGTDFTPYVVDNDTENSINNAATNQFGSTVSVGYGVGQVDPALAAAAGYTSSPAPGVIGNNPTGENSIAQTIANWVTPFDETTYQGGILQTNEAAKAAEEAAAKEAARIAAKKRRDKKAGEDRVDNYKSGGQMFRGQGGR